jgi:integrase
LLAFSGEKANNGIVEANRGEIVVALSDAAVRSAKPRSADYKIADGHGLYLLVRPGGSRLWNLAYRFAGRQKKLSFGAYPVVGLADARAKREEAKRCLAAGDDPGLRKRLAKLASGISAANTFDVVAQEWLARLAADGRDAKTIKKQRWLLKQATPWIGARPIAEITPPEVFDILKRIEASGRLETARGVRTTCSAVFRHAIVTARCVQDPCVPLAGATVAPSVRHHAALVEPRAVAGLLAAMAGYEGDPSTRAALGLLPLTFVRSSELRLARWAEFDFDAAIWTIPAARMKGRVANKKEHIVPLSRQALALVKALWSARGSDTLLFPSLRSPKRPISDNTINAALRRMGYDKTQMTGHGFRTMASTVLNEHGWDDDWIERQLAHVETNKTRRAYNAAEYLEGRTRMMQWWADWLEDLALLG